MILGKKFKWKKDYIIGKVYNMRSINNKSGFTLIEMLIAVSIFSLVLIAATNIYLIINNSQRKVVTLQKIQEDVRFLFEAISQDIRLSSINYDFYITEGININPLRGGSDNNILALVDQNGVEIYYRQSDSGTEIQYCEVTEDINCSLSNPDHWENITPTQVQINYVKFTIIPTADPYTESGEIDTCTSPTHDTCTIGYYCTSSNECRYSADGGNFQPKVIFSISSKGVERNIAEESELIMQSTISTRIFSGQIENLNYD